MISRVLLLCLPLALPAAAFSPVLDLVEPRGGQAGSEVEIHFYGERLDGFAEALFEKPGLTLSDIQVRDDKHVTAKLTIATDASLGEHSLRARTTGGLTELRTFWVGPFPVVAENEPNDSPDKAQRIEPNTTLHGVVKEEDEDYYVCRMKKGERLSVEVEAMRLGRVLFDPYIAILDERGNELAACDDAPLLRMDACASLIVPEDGDYRVIVREAAYEGSDACQYRLHIGTYPRPLAVFPPGAKPGETIDFRFLGDPSGDFHQTITLPFDADGITPLFPEQHGVRSPSPVWIAVSPLESASHTESSSSEAPAILPPLPAAGHGIIREKGASDWWRFSGKKGEEWTIRVIARGIRSPLDSFIILRDSSGKEIARNDDQDGPDSLLQPTLPEDGDYLLEIRDQLGSGAPYYVYRIELQAKSPSISAKLPQVEPVKSQKWKTFPVPRSNRYAAVIQATRTNIACELEWIAESLPEGIVLHAPTIPKAATSFPVLFEAKADAPLAGAWTSYLLRTTGDAPPLSTHLSDEIHHIEVNNQAPYHTTRHSRIATAVTEAAPFRIELEAPKAPLVKNGKLALRIRATRENGFDAPITTRFLWSPPGVSAPVSVEIPPGATEAEYELDANGDASVATWPVLLQAEAETPRGPVLTASNFVDLTVAEPYLAGTFDLSATEQGRSCEMVMKIDVLQPFEGEAVVELLGLPHGASAAAQRFDKSRGEIRFPVEIAADAAVGKHSGVHAKVTIPHGEASICQFTAHGGVLRIDAPSKDPAPAANAPAPPPGAKPLSRLEQLRQQAR